MLDILLTLLQIQQPFTSDANTKLLIHSNAAMGSTTFTDSSSGAHTITDNGDVMHVAPKIGLGMGAFDGDADMVNTPSGASIPDLVIGEDDFYNGVLGIFFNFTHFRCRLSTKDYEQL